MPYVLDLKGKKFGRLTAVEQIKTVRGRGFLWKCQCECGNTHEVFTSILQAGHCRSCGCLQREWAAAKCRGRKLELIGKRFGRLLVTEVAGKIEGRYYWKCDCDCGARAVIQGTRLKNGMTKSCGCLRSEVGVDTQFVPLPPGVTGFRSVMHSYKDGAKRRGLSWEITDGDCHRMFGSDCFYCGIPPSTTRKAGVDSITYNGIDRLDNETGYILSNVVPCCSDCNLAKRGRSVEEFLAWAARLVQHQSLPE